MMQVLPLILILDKREPQREAVVRMMESAHRGTAGPSCCSTTLTMQVWRVVPPTFSTTPSTRGHARTPGASA
ncbi:hypothetical protein CLOM_g23115 [Closterium sp. NIES-68]|nr:hypothetical protein CLOM_g23115 [Closterium sp. NIES-68]